MEAIGLFFTKFSDELLSAQIALLSFSLALAVYWMLVRKKKRETSEWVPAALVKAYLDRMRADEYETRVRLFGDNPAHAPPMPSMASFSQPVSAGAAPQATNTVISNDPALMKEIEALRAQLSMADQRAMEFDRNLNGLKAEKSSLEQKLKEAQAASASAPAGASAGGPDPAVLKELEDAKAKLAEYEVIEDDLANLKKLQKENEQLKQQLAGGAPAAAPVTNVAGGSAPSDSSATKVSGVTEKIDSPVTVVASAPAQPVAAAPAPAATAPAPAPAASPGPESNTNVLAPVTPSVDDGAPATASAPAPAAAEAAAAPEKSSKQKEEELLSEFEKMLAS